MLLCHRAMREQYHCSSRLRYARSRPGNIAFVSVLHAFDRFGSWMVSTTDKAACDSSSGADRAG